MEIAMLIIGLLLGGCISFCILGCMQINRINDYEDEIRRLRTKEARDLLEIVESRYKRNSTIFCSQFDIPGWPEKLSDPLLADAICDRIVHDAYTIVIGGKESMRKRKWLQDI